MRSMKNYILGLDEAGYGPNLGPLVVACVVWKIATDRSFDFGNDDLVTELEQRLWQSIAATQSQLGKGDKVLLIGDSKTLYQTGKLQVLANTILTVLFLCGKKPEHLSELILQFDTASHRLAAQQIKERWQAAGVSLCDVKANVISPREFNRHLERLGNKSTLLTETTLSLIADVLQALPEGDVCILCDKHGGRNRYADSLYQFFPDGWIDILTEGTPLSVYRLHHLGRKIELRFQAKADRHIPAALASMTAKLLRELAMLEFNRFWQQHLPDLKATAGYPVDALRFFGQIDETRQTLGIPKSDIWREK